ncbi:uncharacterized protein [Eurosta solidaginis]|uniref:uncharacterized protein n=1 Tax=Eurosta solidaginis TaxID=178769 RepID=UPI0035306E81
MEAVPFTSRAATSTPRAENRKQVSQPQHSKVFKCKILNATQVLNLPTIPAFPSNKVKPIHHSQFSYFCDETASTNSQAVKRRKLELSTNFNGSENQVTPPHNAIDIAPLQDAMHCSQDLLFSGCTEITSVQAAENLRKSSPDLPVPIRNQSELFSNETPTTSVMSEPDKDIMAMLRLILEKQTNIERRLESLEENKVVRESKVLVKRVHKMVCRITGESGEDIHADLAVMLPMKSIDTLFDFEEKILEKNFEDAVITYFFSLKGSSGELGSVMKHIFTDELLDLFNWAGGGGKKALSALKVVNVALFEIFKLQGRIKFEDDLRKYVIQSHNRCKQRRYLQKKKNSKT